MRRSLRIAGLAEATPGLGKEEGWERKTLGRGNNEAYEKHQERNPVRLRKRVTCPQGVTLDPHLGQHPARSVAPGNWGFLAPQQVSKKAKVSKKGRLAPLGVLAWAAACPAAPDPASPPGSPPCPCCTLPCPVHRTELELRLPWAMPTAHHGKGDEEWKKPLLPRSQTLSHRSGTKLQPFPCNV